MTADFRLATRASPLALWQARWVVRALCARHPRLRVRLVPIVSSGDRDRSTALYDSATVGMFVKEIQAAVVAGEADAGVHSCKDLPTTLPSALALGAILPRADPRDALIGAASPSALAAGAVVGTSSLRRQLQLARLRPDLRFVPIRGNVDTRVRKVRSGEVAATLLACAGLARLGLSRAVAAVPLSIADCCPAPAQGAVAVDCRAGDARALAARLHLAPRHRNRHRHRTRRARRLRRRLLAPSRLLRTARSQRPVVGHRPPLPRRHLARSRLPRHRGGRGTRHHLRFVRNAEHRTSNAERPYRFFFLSLAFFFRSAR